MNEDIENAKILLNWLKDENWQYFHEDGEPYKTISMQDRDILIKYITQLQNNWNELKKWLEEEYKYVPTYYCRMIKIIFNKMQELEQGKDE